MGSFSISDQIVATQEQRNALADNLDIHRAALGRIAEGTSDYTKQLTEVARIKADLSTTDRKLASLKATEARLAAGARPVSEYVDGVHARDRSKPTDNLLGKLALCVYESRVKGTSPDVIAAQRFPHSTAVETLTKAAVNPAMTSVAGWAQELTRQTYGEFIDMLRGASILPAVIPSGQSHTFNGANSIYVPKRVGGPTDLAGAFRAEGAPIPVKGTTFDHVTLTPKSLGIIVTATMEMLQRSAIDLSSYLQQSIVKDTGTLLDQVFVSNSAATAISPAGARAGLVAGDTRASTGASVAQITNDIKVMRRAMASANMGSPATKWLMHPENFFAVSALLTAVGTKAFPETERGELAGIPVVQSTTMPIDIVLLIDFEFYTFALGTPSFVVSEQATIHEDNAPAPISTAGTPNVVAAPVRSLYQTNSWALRMLLDADWQKLHDVGPVQSLTAVSW